MKPKSFAFAALAFAALAAPAYAYCPGAPDGPDSRYVQNGQSRSLCLNKQLTDSTNNLGNEAKWNNLDTTVQRNEIQRRFDSLPRVGQQW